MESLFGKVKAKGFAEEGHVRAQRFVFLTCNYSGGLNVASQKKHHIRSCHKSGVQGRRLSDGLSGLNIAYDTETQA